MMPDMLWLFHLQAGLPKVNLQINKKKKLTKEFN